MSFGGNPAAKYEQTCPECGGNDFAEDQSAGDLICTNCALVIEAHAIDERSEWRTFSNSDRESPDPNRVGGPSNHLLTDGGLSTSIAIATKGSDGGMAGNLQRLNARGADPDRALKQAFSVIRALCEALGLVQNIKDSACELYKQVSDNKSIKGKQTAAVCAALVYVACRQANLPRTFKEIEQVTDASKRDIGRSYKFVTKALGAGMGYIHAAAYIRRFGSQLGLNNTDMRVAEEIANIACPVHDSAQAFREAKPWDGKSPLTIAAAILYLITHLPKASAQPPLPDIAQVSGVAEGTIRNAYKDLYTDLTIVPHWFAPPKDLERLPVPILPGEVPPHAAS